MMHRQEGGREGQREEGGRRTEGCRDAEREGPVFITTTIIIIT